MMGAVPLSASAESGSVILLKEEIKMILKCILIAVGAYLIGAFNGSIFLSSLWRKGEDIRKHGSGNAGATNMARTYGLGSGFLTLAVDVLKTLLCVYVGNKLCGDVGIAVAGLACMIGHCYPVYYHFKGGKGISVGAALGLAIDWRVLVFILIVFLVVAFLSKKVSAGSLAASVGITVASLLFHVSTPKLILAIVAMCIAIWRHKENIQRLLNGTEPNFRAAKPKK